MAVCDRHDFDGLFRGELGRQQRPFFAELKLASMKVSSDKIEFATRSQVFGQRVQ